MRIEVDMSGRIDDANTDTVISYSNKYTYSVLIPSIVKRELFREFHQQKPDRKKKVSFKLKLFSIALFYLLKDKMDNFTSIVIDKEFEGHENDILGMLINLMKKENLNFDKRILIFHLIGKQSKAHEVAIKVYRNILKEDKVLNKEDFNRYLVKRRKRRGAS